MHKYPSVNKVFISGELVENPVYSQSNSGDEVVNFVIINKKKFLSKKHQRINQKSCLVQVTAWNTLAEACKEHLTQGSMVFVTGELEQSNWRSRDGSRRVKLYIVAERVDFIVRDQQGEDLDESAMDEEITEAEDFDRND